MTGLSRCGSDYDGWDVIDPGTECPDCGWVPECPPSNLGALLDLLSRHMQECEGMGPATEDGWNDQT